MEDRIEGGLWIGWEKAEIAARERPSVAKALWRTGTEREDKARTGKALTGSREKIKSVNSRKKV